MASIFIDQNIHGQKYSIINLKEIKEYRRIKKRFFNKATSLLSYVSSFCKRTYAGHIPSQSDIVKHMLEGQPTSDRKIVICAAYLMGEYVDSYLIPQMTKDNYSRFKQKIDYLTINFERLAYFAERDVFNHTLYPWHPTSGFGRNCLSQIDIRFAANSLLYIETVKDIKDMWNSDLVPGALMYLRLYIDNIFKSQVPYQKILDTTNAPINRTGIRRDFIQKQVNLNSPNLRSVDDALLLVGAYSWCCDAVHYGALEDEYLASWVLDKILRITQIFNDIPKMRCAFEVYVKKNVKNADHVDW